MTTSFQVLQITTDLSVARTNELQALNEQPGRYSITAFSERFAGKWKLRAQTLKNVVLDMIDAGYLLQRKPTDSEKEVHHLKGQVKGVLSIGTMPLPPANKYESPK